jgi:monoamine oxidase
MAAIERVSARASRLVAGLVDPSAPSRLVADDARQFDSQSFSATISNRRAPVQLLYRTLIRSLTAMQPVDLSALYAYTMLGSESRGGVGGATRALGGMRDVLDAFRRVLGRRIRTDARVSALEQSKDGVEVVYSHSDGGGRILARACVVAVPAPVVPRIVAGLDTGRTAALESVHYGRFLSVALFLREPVWEGEWAISCDLPVVSTLLDPAVLTGSGPSRVLSSYAGDDGARQVWELSDGEVVDRFVAEISEVFPRLRDVVRGADVRRWDPGYPAWEPGHLEVLSQLTAPVGRIAFCGDYLSIPSVDGAIGTGLRAASDVEAMVG